MSSVDESCSSCRKLLQEECFPKIRNEIQRTSPDRSAWKSRYHMRTRHRYYYLFLYKDETLTWSKLRLRLAQQLHSADISVVGWWLILPAAYSRGRFIRYYDETLIHCTLPIYEQSIGEDEEADDWGEKLVRETSTQYLQSRLRGRVTTTYCNSPLKVMVHRGEWYVRRYLQVITATRDRCSSPRKVVSFGEKYGRRCVLSCREKLRKTAALAKKRPSWQQSKTMESLEWYLIITSP